MSKLVDLIKAQPVYAMGVIQSGIGLAIAFGLPLSAAASGALVVFAAALLSFAVQRVVTPVANPNLPAGTVVNVQGTDRSVALNPSPTLTPADAAADLAGTPRPDNPTP